MTKKKPAPNTAKKPQKNKAGLADESKDIAKDKKVSKKETKKETKKSKKSAKVP